MPGVSERSFVLGLQDFSSNKNRVNHFIPKCLDCNSIFVISCIFFNPSCTVACFHTDMCTQGSLTYFNCENFRDVPDLDTSIRYRVKCTHPALSGIKVKFNT